MIAKLAWSLIRITRLEISVFASACIFLPILLARRDPVTALRYSVPVLTISMCGYVLNNINDIERDRINHPTRPVPQGALSVNSAAALFFLLLAASLASVKLGVPDNSAYLYLLLLMVMISYNYLVEHFAWAKSFVVGIVAPFPLYVVGKILSLNVGLLVLAAAFHVLAIETLSDIEDMKGDGATLPNRIGARRSVTLAFGAKFASDICLGAYSSEVVSWTVTTVVVLIDIAILLFWRRLRPRGALYVLYGELALASGGMLSAIAL